jgi:glycine C-acetyltransferase
MKQKFNFRLLVDDAHGFGTLEKQVLEQVRNKEFKMILMFIFNFAKSMANIGALLQLIKTLLTI